MSDVDLIKKRLKWQCRRGMLELDVPLNRYLDNLYTQATPIEQAAFAQLLTLEDPEIHMFLSRQLAPPTEYQDIVNAILSCSAN